MPIAPVLQRFVDDELALAPALIEHVLAGCLQLLHDSVARFIEQTDNVRH